LYNLIMTRFDAVESKTKFNSQIASNIRLGFFYFYYVLMDVKIINIK
jgi:hypothetical protein